MAWSLATLWVLALSLETTAPGALTKAEAEGLTCVHFETQVVSTAYGYDHVVRLDNTCDEDATCRVRTSVSDATVTQAVPTGEKRDVITFRGSPSREFEATVQCQPERTST